MGSTVSRANRTLSDFLGRWAFERAIEHADGSRATVTGRATFTPDGDGLLQEEIGQMSLGGAPPLTTTRRYLWRGGLAVRFDDGRAFHTVPPDGGRAEHWCEPDRYIVSYDFSRWPKWTTTWTVRGPRKDYRMVTHYIPL
jgi:hypothetical protein